MTVGKNLSGSNEHVLTYDCRNKKCPRKPKSFYGGVLFDSIANQMRKIEFDEKLYDKYKERLDSLTGEKIIEIKEEIRSLNGAMSHMQPEIKQMSRSLSRLEENTPAYNTTLSQIDELAAEEQELSNKIKTLEAKIQKPESLRRTKDDFLNELKSAPDKIEAGSAAEKDRICRIFFLNVRVDNDLNVKLIWRKPFDSLIKSTELSSGARERT